LVAGTQDLRDLRQWLVWRSEERDGKPTKIPYSPLTGSKASSTDPKTWAGYPEAVSVCKERGFDGVGFVFTSEDDLCGVDLDGCLNPETGEIEGWAQEIIEELNSYTEISPSGAGVHVLVRATLPEGRNRKGRFEVYDRARYFAVTGEHLAGTPQGIESRQEELRVVVCRVFGDESTNGHKEPITAPEPADNGIADEEIVRKALAASNGERFTACGPETWAVTGAIPRRTWRCAGCSRSGLGETPQRSTPYFANPGSTGRSGIGTTTAAGP
jgi:primase-polymerase (primpol)-like protein